MGINVKQFRDEIIVPTLRTMAEQLDKRMYSDSAVMMLLETACAESQLTYVKQIGGGPALGFFQMEPATYTDIFNWICLKGKEYYNRVSYCIYELPESNIMLPNHTHLIHNIRLQTVFARLHYWRVKDPIPEASPARAEYWKKFYNTPLGKGTVAHYLNSIPASL